MTPPIQEPGEGLNAAVAAELRAEQGRQRLSVQALAEMADIPYGSLRRYLNAERHVDVATLAAICSALGVAPAEVVLAAARALDRESSVIELRRPDVSVDEDNIEDLYDEPSAAEPQRQDVEGDVDPDLQ